VNDELQRRINEHVLNGDAPSIIWAMEGQIRINTKLEAKLAELERREALLTEYHASCERFFAQYNPNAFTDEGTYAAVIYAREALRQHEETSK
jgi:hypothetical protein